MKFTAAKEAARVLSEAEKSTRYWFTGNEEIGMKESNVLSTKTMSRYYLMSLSSAVS